MSSLPDFEAWAAFAKVADTGSFAQAAAELGLSKATVSKFVARLEARLGASLLNRTSRRVSLTEIGRVSAVAAARMIADAEGLEATAMAQSATTKGTVRVAAPMSFGVAYLAPALPALLEAFPGLSIDLQLSDEPVDLIAGRFDLALRIAALPDSTLRARRLCAVRRLVVATPAYLDRRGRPAHPSELTTHACLGYTNLPTPDRWRFIHTSGEEVVVTPAGPLRSNNGDALTPALMAGMGLAVQPEFLVWRDIAAGRLEPVLRDWSAPPVALNIITPPAGLRPASVAAVIVFLVRHLSTAPWAAVN